jgi:hypothetical protein
MTNEEKAYPTFSYDAHARTCAQDDFLGQVRRTVNGVPFSDEQVEMVVEAVRSGLTLEQGDVLLELACGNGSLSNHLFDACKGYMGIDCSDYLISVAKRHFEQLPNFQFERRTAADYLREETLPLRFSKALCYAGFQYFSEEEAPEILRALYARFSNLKKVFIGNMPDKANVAKFYRDRTASPEELGDCSTAIGVWRTRAEFSELAEAAGWTVTCSTMPSEYQLAHYRFDAILTRNA